MSRPAISIRSERRLDLRLAVRADDVPPRARASLRGELAEMDECMPHYYKITNGHGQGAETDHARARRPLCRGASPTRTSRWRAPMRKSRAMGRRTWRSAATSSHSASRWYAEVGAAPQLCRAPHGAAAAPQRRVAQSSGTPSAPTATPCAGETELIPEVFARAPARLASTSSRRASR